MDTIREYGSPVDKLPHHDFSQISSDQANLIRVWYWLAIFSRRYSSAAQTYALEDAQALQKAADGSFTTIINIIHRIQPRIRNADDLLVIHKKYDAVYKGVLNLVNYETGGYLNFQNSNPVSTESSLEDHHIFPFDYLKKSWAYVHETLDSEVAIDCVVNRTLIPKLTNIRVSNKAPSHSVLRLSRRGASSAKGDVLMVTRLDRLARSTRDLLNTLAAITGREAGFRSLGDIWADTTTAHGRLMLAVLGGLAEFERELISARNLLSYFSFFAT